MSEKLYDYTVVIGRFQPVHNAHIKLIEYAASISKNSVIVLIGSANQPSTYKNPFSYADRASLIEESTDYHCIFEPIEDSIYSDTVWISRVQSVIAKNTLPTDKIAIVGHKKDLSSAYLDWFPNYDTVPVEEFDQLNATDIRSLYFDDKISMNYLKNVVPEPTYNFLEAFASSHKDKFDTIVEERKFLEKYKKQYEVCPYPPVFVTTDAVVVCNGHVLMIRRKAVPGKGLYALPGGFLDTNNDISVKSGMLRELKEETNIKVPLPVLEGHIKDSHVFDAISRSSRGRTITHAFYIQLHERLLPKVKGGDDAQQALWFPLGTLDSSKIYEDHAEIIRHFTSI